MVDAMAEAEGISMSSVSFNALFGKEERWSFTAGALCHYNLSDRVPVLPMYQQIIDDLDLSFCKIVNVAEGWTWRTQWNEECY
ncbi:Peptidyl-tRNA hydrolase family protein [Quillaja saponaria]|uniref:Peptidyl-tRNA hydrolase family protein n=1 Tax=Quillaja saponaria TaxID=32244 RepID=A0AAD7M468_QUISA|nr:Peptidyl-tRNA hydrolase family protein [Quillaja saponaria]